MADNRPAGDGQRKDDTPPGGSMPPSPPGAASVPPQAGPAGTGPAGTGPAGTGPAPGRPGAGFASGGVHDKALPGPSLATSVTAAAGTGWAYGQISDDELIGVLGAWQRTESWAAAGRLAAIAELIRRRPADACRDRATYGGDPAPWGKFCADEVAVAMNISRWAAEKMVGLAHDLATRLPLTCKALREGGIDAYKAQVIAEATRCLDDAAAAAAEAAINDALAGKTPGQIRALIARAVLKADPGAARNRRDQAQRDARVELWREDAGTAAIVSFGLPPDEALAADQRITARAMELKAAGVPGSMDRLRVRAYLDALLGQDTTTRYRAERRPAVDGTPPGQSGPLSDGPSAVEPGQSGRPGGGTPPGQSGPDGGGTSPGDPGESGYPGEPGQSDRPSGGAPPSQSGRPGNGTSPCLSGRPGSATSPGESGYPGEPGQPGRPSGGAPPSQPDRPGNGTSLRLSGRPGCATPPGESDYPGEPGQPGGGTSPGEPGESGYPGGPGQSGRPGGGTSPGGAGRFGASGEVGPPAGTGGAGHPATLSHLAARINLTVPLATLLGLAEHPGEASGFGPIDPALARILAAQAAGHQATSWCVTVTDSAGHPLALGCGRPGRRKQKTARSTGPARPGTQPPRTPPRDTGPAGLGSATGPPGQPTLSANGPPGGYGAWRLRPPGPEGTVLPDLTVDLEPIPVSDCDHSHQTASHDPSRQLRHLVEIRDGECTWPPCRREARRCDYEHTIAWEDGGRTCACNGGPRCRHHHHQKQAAGWRLEQSQPGCHTWVTPAGRSYTTGSTTYPI